MRYRIRCCKDGQYEVERRRGWILWRRVGYVQYLPGLEDMWMPLRLETYEAARELVNRAIDSDAVESVKSSVVWEAGG